MDRTNSHMNINGKVVGDKTTKEKFIELFHNELKRYNAETKIFRFENSVIIEGFNAWVIVAFDDLDNFKFIELKNADPELSNSYEKWSNHTAKLAKKIHDNFLKSLLGNPDNIRLGSIEYILEWAIITSYEDPRSGDSAINIGFIF